MAYVPREAVEEASRTGVLEYLSARDPGNLVDLGGGNWCTREHDSLKISNGKWYWFSRGTGGVSALDYLMKVEGLTLPQAVEEVTGVEPVSRYIGIEPQAGAAFELPEPADDSSAAEAYLVKRGISREIIRRCMSEGILYQSKKYCNAVFVGKDSEGVPRFAAVRSIYGPYRGDVKGSDKRWSFRVRGEGPVKVIRLFESAIDLLSWQTLCMFSGERTDGQLLLSLSGVGGRNALPPALEQSLADEPETVLVAAHLDNDEAGRGAAAAIEKLLEGRTAFRDEPPATGKDVNDMLLASVYGQRPYTDRAADGGAEIQRREEIGR